MCLNAGPLSALAGPATNSSERDLLWIHTRFWRPNSGSISPWAQGNWPFWPPTVNFTAWMIYAPLSFQKYLWSWSRLTYLHGFLTLPSTVLQSIYPAVQGTEVTQALLYFSHFISVCELNPLKHGQHKGRSWPERYFPVCIIPACSASLNLPNMLNET